MRAPPLPGLLRRGSIVTVVASLTLSAAVVHSAAAPAVRHYTVTGARTTGGANPVQSPILQPGLYRDSFAEAGADFGDGTAKYYRVRLARGDTPYLSVTEAAPGPAPTLASSLRVGLALAPVDRSVTGCVSKTATATGDALSDGLDSATAILAPGVVGGPDWDCPVDTLYALQVTRSGAAFPGRTLDVEIAFRIEPTSAPPAGGPGTGTSATNVRASADGPPRTVIGGTGFGDAPTLPDGRYRDSFAPGERRFYRVHLQWGQRLAWTLAADQLPQIKDYEGARGSVVLTNPVRQVLDQPDDVEDDGDDLGATTGTLYGSTLVPVAWADRRSDDDDVTPYAIDGDYYLVVSTAYPSSGRGTDTVPYTLTVQAVGTPTEGPDYVVDGSADPRTSTDRTPVVVATVIGAVVILAVAVVLLLRRRRRGPTGQRVTQT